MKEHENFPRALAIIEDHDSILTYVTYVSLMLEAIPPNFYSYHGGKAGAAARVSALLARFAAGAKKVKGVKNAAKALDSFIKAAESLIDVLKDYLDLAEKLAKRGLGKFKGNPAMTLTAKKKAVKRNATCRLCHSDEHKTPRVKRGELEYI
ncbi:hypothetical protein [Vibrio mexicanus]|uniref:hypothetical protein n=1 Tax=Vibrio mexicanus TaxID=1004326 RepID=UPI00063CCBC7|nr:hypothetical protein [Vibrio mexicanus]